MGAEYRIWKAEQCTAAARPYGAGTVRYVMSGAAHSNPRVTISARHVRIFTLNKAIPGQVRRAPAG